MLKYVYVYDREEGRGDAKEEERGNKFKRMAIESAGKKGEGEKGASLFTYGACVYSVKTRACLPPILYVAL